MEDSVMPRDQGSLGGHNYCCNHTGDFEMEEPWCFTDDMNNIKQVSVSGNH